jgi:hypothetical protein
MAYSKEELKSNGDRASPFLIVYTLPPVYEHHQHKPKADMYHLISSHPGSPDPPNGVFYSTAHEMLVT